MLMERYRQFFTEDTPETMQLTEIASEIIELFSTESDVKNI